jgi:hypothetical protein
MIEAEKIQVFGDELNSAKALDICDHSSDPDSTAPDFGGASARS